MDGEMTIRDLKMTYNYKQKEAEIVFWKIQLEKQYKQQKAKEKKDLLRIDETKYICTFRPKVRHEMGII